MCYVIGWLVKYFDIRLPVFRIFAWNAMNFFYSTPNIPLVVVPHVEPYCFFCFQASFNVYSIKRNGIGILSQ